MVPGSAGFISRQIDQVAFVVEDIDEAIPRFSELYGLDRWSVWRDLATGQANRTYYGEEEDFRFSAAYAFTGDGMTIELCQHDGGRSVYDGWLAGAKARLHHIAFLLADDDEHQAAADRFEAQGARYAMGAGVPGTNRWGYFDTVATTGVFTEIYSMSPAAVKVFDRMKAGEVFDAFPWDD